MDKKQIKHITNEHYRKLKKYFNRIGPGFDSEAIHQFRVEYKKLRAFLRMLSHPGKAGKIKIPRKLKRIYNCTGSIRDLQLQEQRLIKALKLPGKKPQACIHQIQPEIDKMKLLFSEIADETIITEAKKNLVNALPGKCSLKGFKEFAAKKWKEINDVISVRQFPDKQIHSIRKNLKDLFYNLKNFKGTEIYILSQGKWNDYTVKHIEALLVDLGNFQDSCMAVDLLKLHCAAELKSNADNKIKQLEKEWKLEKQRRKRFVIKKLKQAAAV